MSLPVPTADAFGNTIQPGDTIAVAASGGATRVEMVRGTITRLGPGWVWYRADRASSVHQPPVPDAREAKTKRHLVVRLGPVVEAEQQIRAQVADAIAALRHDHPMSSPGSADRAFNNALVVAERTARGAR